MRLYKNGCLNGWVKACIPRCVLSLIAVTILFISLAIDPGKAYPDVGISITPTSLSPTIAVGDRTQEVISISNTAPHKVRIESSMHDAPDIEGAAEVKIEPGIIELEAGETAEVEIQITVPEEAQDGKQKRSIIFDASGIGNDTISIIGRVKVTLDIDVIHPVSDVKFTYARLIDSSDAAVFTMEGRNTANFSTRMEGTVKIDRIFGEDIILQSASEAIANDESTELRIEWRDAPNIGLARMTASMTTGVGAPVTESSIILVFPWKITSIIVVIIGIIYILRRFVHQPKEEQEL